MVKWPNYSSILLAQHSESMPHRIHSNFTARMQSRFPESTLSESQVKVEELVAGSLIHFHRIFTSIFQTSIFLHQRLHRHFITF